MSLKTWLLENSRGDFICIHSFMYFSIFSLAITLGIQNLIKNKKYSFSRNHKGVICQRMKQFMEVYHLSTDATNRSCANPSLRVTLGVIGCLREPPVKKTAIVNFS